MPTCPPASAGFRAQSAGPSGSDHSMRPIFTEAWKPTKVTVSNFRVFGSNVNALSPKERDTVAKKILDRLPAEVSDGVHTRRSTP